MQSPAIDIPLFNALKTKNIEGVKSRLAAGANPNSIVGAVLPAMHTAASEGFVPGLEALVAAGGKVDLADQMNCAPLRLAAGAQQVEAGRWLLRRGADDSIQDSLGNCPVSVAMGATDSSFLKMLLAERPLIKARLPEVCKDRVETISSLDTVRLMLDHGVDPNLVINAGSPWLVAIQSPWGISADVTDLLLRAGANVNAQDCVGRTALHRAVDYGNFDAFKYLLCAGADPDIPHQYGITVRQSIYSGFHEASNICRFFKAWDSSWAAHQVIQRSNSLGKVNHL